MSIRIPDGEPVSGLLLAPADVRAGCVVAHGAGAGMAHPFMARIAEGLPERGGATDGRSLPTSVDPDRLVDVNQTTLRVRGVAFLG